MKQVIKYAPTVGDMTGDETVVMSDLQEDTLSQGDVLLNEGAESYPSLPGRVLALRYEAAKEGLFAATGGGESVPSEESAPGPVSHRRGKSRLDLFLLQMEKDKAKIEGGCLERWPDRPSPASPKERSPLSIHRRVNANASLSSGGAAQGQTALELFHLEMERDRAGLEMKWIEGQPPHAQVKKSNSPLRHARKPLNIGVPLSHVEAPEKPAAKI